MCSAGLGLNLVANGQRLAENSLTLPLLKIRPDKVDLKVKSFFPQKGTLKGMVY